ncbi:hypothetical protein EYZ11_010396 [Aspergillus tanneri]|uniref:SH3 domain-containing protein n=1 Tax=Aspergillus tanneri TaxID=1220188 RepID=A0A4S3J607_9EURO|nr:hypothetical protein EYZ11_010396 [Aspergillus tanneri]
MAPGAPQLPTRFPCWCRAVYSWGGETNRDLGFVEGDLIECLNAGDGQWWMGRLRRDRRMMGLFPSNFVEVLGENFVPVSSSASPMVAAAQSPIMNPTSAPKKQKTVFRRPFQAHKEAMAPSGELSRSGTSASPTTTTPTSSIPQTPPRDGSLSRKVKPLRNAATTVKHRSSVARPSSQSGPSTHQSPRTAQPRPEPRSSATPTAPILAQPYPSSRAVSPRPPQEAELSLPSLPPGSSSMHSRPPSRAVSPRPPNELDYLPPSVPMQQNDPYSHASSREISPLQLQEREESPPPPPPPPHRVAVNRQPTIETGVPARFDMNDRYVTMSNMGLPRQTHSASPQPMVGNPWSPDAYESLRGNHQPSHTIGRSLTSLGFDGDKDYDRPGVPPHRGSVYATDHFLDGPPQLNNYVQKMESRLRQMQAQNRRGSEDIQLPEDDDEEEEDDEEPPPPPPKNVPYHGRHNSVPVQYSSYSVGRQSGPDLRGDILNRSYTNKSSTTNSSGVQSISTNLTASTERTNQSFMSGASAGGFSATSAGSYARRNVGANGRPNTAVDTFRGRGFSDAPRMARPETPLTGISYHSSHNTSRQGASSAIPWTSPDTVTEESAGVFGGLSTPKAKKHGFFKKILESAKTGAANARSSIAVGQSGGSYSPTKGRAISPIRASPSQRDTAREMGLGGAIDWVQVRRDVNRASSPSRNERVERAERCQMMDHPVIYAVEELYESAEGDESIDGLPISEPTDFAAANLSLVDKSARFVNSLPPMTNPMSLAQGYVCRPYKSDVQRLRALFTWVSEKIAWDEPVEGVGLDLRRVLQTKRGSPQEVAYLVREMCAAVGLHAEAIKGFLKAPGDLFELDSLARANHWWNAVLVDGEWRIMDCSLASPTNPRRSQFVTSVSSCAAESWYFLARPLEICYTHVPLVPEEQHICPPISPDVLLALPPACPQYFKMSLHFPDYDTSLVRIDGLEVMQVRLLVPPDVECAAEVEAPTFARDADGDFFESGEVVRKRALAQPDWIKGQKRVTIKAVLPGDEGQGVVKIYAGPRGLMHSSRDIPHPLALALPIVHTGDNPPYEFVLRHPTPHAQRHDLYIMQPQCSRLAVNNTFVFAVRQHPSSPPVTSQGPDTGLGGRISPSILSRPASALSMVSSSAGGSSVSTVSNEFSASTSAISSTRSSSGREKPAKLAIQSPSGKILRLSRKADHMVSTTSSADSATDDTASGSVWETVIKIGERGVWRGLVLADRVARWCVFCEWECY